MKKYVTGLSLCALFITACPKKEQKPKSEVVARVNQTEISKADFDFESDRVLSRFKSGNNQIPAQLEARIKDSTLKRMIEDQMIRDKAKSLAVTITPEELEQKLTEYKTRFSTPQDFQDFLARSKSTEAQIKQSIEMQILRDRVFDKLAPVAEVADTEIEAYYNEHRDNFKDPERVHVRHILAKVDMPAIDANKPESKEEKATREKQIAENKKKAKEKIEKAQKRLAKKEAFDAVAKDMSDDLSTKDNGGDLGFVMRGRGRAMQKAFEEAAFKLKPTQVSTVVETESGFHLIKVEEKQEEHQRTLEEVKANIKSSLMAKKRSESRRDLMKKMRDESKVEELVKFDDPSAIVPKIINPAQAPSQPTVAQPQQPVAPQPEKNTK